MFLQIQESKKAKIFGWVWTKYEHGFISHETVKSVVLNFLHVDSDAIIFGYTNIPLCI